MRALLLALAAALPCHAQSGPKFRDVAADAGLGGVPAYRVLLTDVDGDGRPDAVLQLKGEGHKINPGGEARLFMNVAGAAAPGGRKFVEEKGGIPARGAGAPEGAQPKAVLSLFGDVDNDGRADVFRGTYQEPADHPEAPDTGERNSVYLAKGMTRRFAVVTNSGLGKDGPATTCGAVFLDYDRDGKLDLFCGNWYVHFGKNLIAHPDRLYRGDGTGVFADVTEKAGLLTKPTVGEADSSRPTYGVAHTDFDGDGWQDVATATYGRQWNRLWRNNGDGTFTNVAPKLGFDGDGNRDGAYPDWTKTEPQLKDKTKEPPFRSNGNSFTTAPADVDADGDVDFFVAEITHSWAGESSDLSALLVNEAGKFTRVTKPFERIDFSKKWRNQGDYLALWADFDNDGLLDLLLGSGSYPDDQRLRIWRQDGKGGWEDATRAWGLDFPDVQHLAADDVDGDGAVDILASGQVTDWNRRTAPPLALWRNTPDPGRHWVELTLEGSARPGAVGGANRSAFGARVWVTAGGKTQMREVLSAVGHFGLAPARTLHFGLGTAKTIEKLRVQWPDQALTSQEFTDVEADRHWWVRQGEGELRECR